jgi:hypothetical protein
VLVCCAGLSPLSPVLKSLLADNEPAAVLHRGRESLMRRIESRFRFLAVRARSSRASFGRYAHYTLLRMALRFDMACRLTLQRP